MNGATNPRNRALSLVSGGEFDRDAAGQLPWLWEPYLAFGAVSVLDGDPGVGKSLVATDLAARIGLGRPMPDGSRPAVNPVNGKPMLLTVFVNAEDSVRHTLVPRLLAADGEPRLALFAAGIGEGGGKGRALRLPDDVDALRDLLVRKLDLRGSLVVLDPMSAVFANAGSSDQAVRAAIDPLVRLAADTYCCFLLVRHLNKQSGRKALYRGGGSIGVGGAGRTVLVAGPHPDDPDRRVLAMSKSNLGPLGPSLGYRIVAAPERTGPALYVPGEKHPVTGELLTEPTTVDRRVPPGPVIRWDGVTPVTADDIVNARPDALGGQSARAAEFLKQLLANGPVPAAEVEAKAAAEGIAFRTLCSAKKKLGIESRRITRDGQPCWEWVLNAAAPEGAQWRSELQTFSPIDWDHAPAPLRDGDNLPPLK